MLPSTPAPPYNAAEQSTPAPPYNAAEQRAGRRGMGSLFGKGTHAGTHTDPRYSLSGIGLGP